MWIVGACSGDGVQCGCAVGGGRVGAGCLSVVGVQSRVSETIRGSGSALLCPLPPDR